MEPSYDAGDNVYLLNIRHGDANKPIVLRIVKRYFEPGTTDDDSTETESKEGDDQSTEHNGGQTSLSEENPPGDDDAEAEDPPARRGWYCQLSAQHAQELR